MNGTESISIDLATLLIFTMPGFFFVWAHGKKKNSDFEYFMFSMFWGVVLYWIFYRWFPVGNYIHTLQNPLAGAIAFSFCALVLGSLLKKLTRPFR